MSQDREVIRFVDEVLRFGDDYLEFKDIRLKDGFDFEISVTVIHDATVMLEMIIRREDDALIGRLTYDLEVGMDTSVVLNGRLVDVESFVDGGYGRADGFLSSLCEYLIMTEGRLFIENGGFSVNVYLRLRGYEEMVSIDRDEAKDYFVFTDEEEISS